MLFIYLYKQKSWIFIYLVKKNVLGLIICKTYADLIPPQNQINKIYYILHKENEAYF